VGSLASSAHSVVDTVRRFVESEVRPGAADLEHADRYPERLVDGLRELGLFGALVPTTYGGLGLDVATYARVIEELCRGWMSLAGVINSHTMAALIVLHHGTEEQRARFLPRFARGEARGGLCLTEPHAGSDVQAIRTVARRHGDHYVLDGTKMFVTNGREGNTFALLALTAPGAEPRHRGMSCFIVEKGAPGLRVVKSIGKLGYKGVDTAELLFEAFAVPVANLVGGIEGRGFHQVMSGLEAGRINIAARAVGVAQAAWEDALHHVRHTKGEAPGELADMAIALTAARCLTSWAAELKDKEERCDVEAGMAKLYASEMAQELAASAMRLHGRAGILTRFNAERYYRDTPLMIIGEGTNEIQRTIIARGLVARYGERAGAVLSRDGEPEERRQLVLAVRQFVEKSVVPVASEHERANRYPLELVALLAELGVLGAVVPASEGGLELDLRTYVMLVEELARGSATLAGVVTTHATVTRALAGFASAELREALLPRLARGELLAAAGLAGVVTARQERDDWLLSGTAALVDNAPRADVFLVLAGSGDESRQAVVVGRDSPGLSVGGPEPGLGGRGLHPAGIAFDGVRVPPAAVLGSRDGREPRAVAATLALARLGRAATAVGLAQAAFEAALRYAQQRSTFGKPICHHQAIQLKLADMATRTTAARRLTEHAAARLDATPDDDLATRMAGLAAAQTAYEVTLEAMRVHGGYGYTTEFPVERFYRDAGRLLVMQTDGPDERRELARALLAAP
jgi:alkylation response protein AidB-like acyl-CoA dehydrogenase